MSIEGKSVGGSITSKCSMDVNAHKFCNIKKISMETTGSSVLEVDVPNALKNTTFMMRLVLLSLR